VPTVPGSVPAGQIAQKTHHDSTPESKYLVLTNCKNDYTHVHLISSFSFFDFLCHYQQRLRKTSSWPSGKAFGTFDCCLPGFCCMDFVANTNNSLSNCYILFLFVCMSSSCIKRAFWFICRESQTFSDVQRYIWLLLFAILFWSFFGWINIWNIRGCDYVSLTCTCKKFLQLYASM